MKKLLIQQSITRRDCGSLDKYFSEVEKIPLLTVEEEVILSRKIQQGDLRALEKLTTANLRFVISVAKQYQNQGLTLEDLINEGNIGLMIAGQRYDESKGFKFISYAVWWIRQSIITAIAKDARIVRLPYNRLTLLSKLYKAFSKLEQKYGRKPSVEEIGTYLGIHVDKVVELISQAGTKVSIDEPLVIGEEWTLLDRLPNNEGRADRNTDQESTIKIIRASLGFLNNRDREMIVLYFGLESYSPLSLEDIAHKFNISKEHASRLKERALKRIRNCSNVNALLSCFA